MASLKESETQSRETSTKGVVNDRPVEFTYTSLSGDDTAISRLSWRSLNSDDKEEDAVDKSDIIAVLDLSAPEIPVNGYSSLVRHDSETENGFGSFYKILALDRLKLPVEEPKDENTENTDSKVDSTGTSETKIETPPKPFLRSIITRDLPGSFLQDFPPLRERPSHFDIPRYKDDSPNLHIIVSILSGTRLAHAFSEDVVQPTLASFGITPDQYIVHETESIHTVTDLTRSIFLPRAQEGVQQTIILLSGDGGVSDAVNGLLSSKGSDNYVKPVIGLLALGTGNALAHSMNILNDSTLGLSNLLKGGLRSLPLFLARFSPGAALLVDEGRRTEDLHIVVDGDAPDSVSGAIYGTVVCSWGFHAALVADSDTVEYRKFGAKRFQMAAKEALFPSDGSPPHAYKATVSLIKRVEADDKDDGKRGKKRGKNGHDTSPKPDSTSSAEITQSSSSYVYTSETIPRDSHSYILATLASELEKGFTISPDSRPLDGRLRVVHFGPMSGDEIMRVMGLAYQGGQHIHDPDVSYEEVEGLRIDFANGGETDPRWRRICVDGKIVRVEQDGWVEVKSVDGGVVDVVFA